jgi:mRNA interferase MazF
MQRGEGWWAEMPQPVGRRPVVLLSRDSAYMVRTSVTVGIITRTIRGIPVEVPLGIEDGLSQKCVINLDEIITIPKNILTECITKLPTVKMTAVAEAIRFALDLKE